MIKGFNYIVKIFEQGNTMVIGERGTGKDMIFGNVIARRKLGYISNCEYPRKKGIQMDYYPLDFKAIDVGGNTYKDFINGTVKYYKYPYPKGVDIYITDGGVYLPSQYCNELNRDYKSIPIFAALSRQIGKCNLHTNSQAYGRIYDKLREQSRRYICCVKCKVLPIFKKELVIQKVRIYERHEACQNFVPPLRLPFWAYVGKDKMMAKLYKLNYQIQHGNIEEITLIYWNQSDYNTDIFEEILAGGIKDHEED